MWTLRIRFKTFLHSTHFGKRMVYLSHTLYCIYKTFAGAKRTASSPAMEVLLELPPLSVMTEAEAQSWIYRLMCS